MYLKHQGKTTPKGSTKVKARYPFEKTQLVGPFLAPKTVRRFTQGIRLMSNKLFWNFYDFGHFLPPQMTGVATSHEVAHRMRYRQRHQSHVP